METNDIRNYNLTNTSTVSMKYVEKITALKTEEDKDACLRLLTLNNNSHTLCRAYYTTEHIKSSIEYSDYLLHFTSQDRRIVAFALVQSKSKRKGRILDIQLACAIPNTNKFGKMIAHSIYTFAVKHKYPFLYVSPRTPELRATFVKYGFEPIHGIEGIDELLEKEIDMNIPRFNTRGKTQKRNRTPSHSS
jgi:hypothetical protein